VADAHSEQDRSEPATPFKLEEARRRGQVAKSVEINSIVVLSITLAAALAFGTAAFAELMEMATQLLVEAGRARLGSSYLTGLYAWAGGGMFYLVGPLLLAVLVGAALASILQTGPVFSFEPLRPDFKRLNPAEGFKRLLSMRTVFEAGKTVVKLGVLGATTVVVVGAMLPDVLSLLQRTPESYPRFFVERGGFLMFCLLMGFLAIALVDLTFTRWDYLKRMRMSRRELRDEVKRREGDPQVRSKRRELQRALRKKSASTARVPDADVLITNPTHLAIGLEYRRGEMAAPRVICKGSDQVAARMRELAFRHRVPVVEDPPLARALYRSTELDAPIPEDTYPAVARILRGVFDTRAAGARS